MIELDLLDSKSQDSSCLFLLRAGTTDVYHEPDFLFIFTFLMFKKLHDVVGLSVTPQILKSNVFQLWRIYLRGNFRTQMELGLGTLRYHVTCHFSPTTYLLFIEQ